MTEATSELVIWRNGRLATLNPDHAQPYGLLERHALLVRDGRIAAIVAEDDVPSGRSIDLEGRLVTPGLIDCHTHLVFGGSRAQEWEQRLNGVSYQTISASGGGINSTVRATRDSSEAELLALAQPRLERLLREGVTTLEIKSGYGLDLPNERKMLRVARQLADHNGVELSATLLSAHATPPEYQGDADGYITLVCETILPTLWQEGLFESVDVFCENVGFSPQQTERVFQAAQAMGIPVKGHVEQLSSLGGAQLVSRYHGLSADHIEYLTEEGVAAMRESGTVAALPYPLAMWFLLSSLLTWLIYGADKLAARKAWRRVPETTLLVLGLAGGWPGAILGQQCFRHKTQKQPFRTRFFISVALNVAALAGLYVVYTHLLSR